MRGRATVLVLVLLILAAAGIAVTHAWLRRKAAERTDRDGLPAVVARTARPVAHAAGMGHAQLLAAASRALAEHRLLVPAGDNAFVYYLEARKRQPHNPVADAALRELFPFAVQSAEQTINAGHLEQAQREIGLLERADPTNYSLTILRGKLEAQRRLADAGPVAVPKAKPGRTRLAKTGPVAGPGPAPHARVPPTPAPEARATPNAGKPVAMSAQAVAVKKTTHLASRALSRTPPLLLRDVRPAYPEAARRAHRQGWVDVSYTVDRRGRVVDARVVDAHPTHMFDVAALSAVRHWEFKPARVDGHPVAQKVSSRIQFRM
jgi:periplasmic protein TonB